MSDTTRSPLQPPPPPSPIIPLKRKEPENDNKQFSPGPALPSGATDTHQGEYEKGRITCEFCGTGVGFRDEDTGGFTLKHWEAHRLTCSMPGGPSSTDPVIYTPESTAEALAHPPTKRRRAKRTEEERIDYLRADPYVAQFEAYRVLCASCDKWIRLRPNSTYCSIPWDAHRKSCLAKKVNSKNVYALEERNALFSKDPDIRKFDAERVLCSICDKWLSVNPDDHLQAVQKWLQHRAACQKNSTAILPPNRSTLSEPVSAPLLTEPQMAVTISPAAAATTTTTNTTTTTTTRVQPLQPQPQPQALPPPHHHSTSPISPKPGSSFAQSNNNAQPRSNHVSDNSSFHDYNPSNYAPTHESRRRNAEQRAATLRADALITEVEPNRVFCSLCQKWVQLRQDSSYCAYPWLQHRGKCLARHQRRVQKAAETVDLRDRKHRVSPEEEEDELMSENDGAGPGTAGTDGPESEEGIDSHAEEDRFRRNTKEVTARRVESRHGMMTMKELQRGNNINGNNNNHSNGKARARSGYHFSAHHPIQSRHSLCSTSTGYRHHEPRGGNGLGPLLSSSSSSYAHHHNHNHHHHHHRVINSGTSRVWDDDDLDGGEGDDGVVDVDTYMIDEDRPVSRVAPSRPQQHQTIRRPLVPPGLADLDSLPGRRDFVLASIEYLFRTTYETTDDMTISALLVYLNAAMPQDKHEDFDTAEVTKTAAQLHDKGRIIFEGDIIRLPD